MTNRKTNVIKPSYSTPDRRFRHHFVISPLDVWHTLGRMQEQADAQPTTGQPLHGMAALLAAGAGSRYIAAGGEGSHKLVATLSGRPLWHHALAAVVAAGFERVVVVTGAIDLELPDGTPSSVEVCHNPHWAEGQATSLAVAVAAARRHGATHLTVGLADQPGIPASAWKAAASAPADCRIVITRYAGTPGPNPVRLSAEVWPHLPTAGDEGARTLIRMRPDWLCHVDCPAPADAVLDVDTPEDLLRWNN
jgi:CTP:molybdopterin cytidylyltransferase MocA